MKRQLIIYITFFIMGLHSSVCNAQAPWDLVYHALPPSTTFDISEEVSQISGNLQSSYNQSQQIINQAKADITATQTAITSTFNDIKNGNVVNFNNNGGVSGSTFCGKDVKDVSVKDIAKKVKEILLTYNSKKIDDINKQQEMRDKFYIESAYLIYRSAEGLEKQLKENIAANISTAKECAEGDGTQCNMPSSEEGGNNEVLFTYGQTLKTFESVVRVWENVAALKAQLRAIKSIKSITPQVKASDKSALNFGISLPPVLLHQSESYAFAQLSYNEAALSLSNVESKIVSKNSEPEQLIKSTIEFASPKEADNEHPLVAAESKIEALSSLTSIENTVTEAMNTHNMLGSLYEYKQMADQIVNMQQDYDASLQKLKNSEQCTINYLSKYFNDPEKVWSGISLGDYVNSHELRSGISAWAIDAYETAKAAETSTITSDDVAQVSFDETTRSELEDDPDMSKAAQIGQSFNVSVNTSKQEDAQDENRKSALLPWQIGAEASKLLGTNASDWGTPIGRKMVWNDTKNFYKQYLRRKYDNIKTYLKGYTKEDVLALVISKFRGEDQDISETKYQQALQTARDNATQELVSISQNQMLGYDQSSQDTINTLQKQRASLVAEMDTLNNVISKNSNEISDIRNLAEQSAAEEIDSVVNAKVVYPAVGSTVATSSVKNKIIGADKLSSSISAAKVTATDDKKISSLEEEISTNKDKLNNYNTQLEEIDKQISLSKLQAQSSSGLHAQQIVSSIAQAQEKWNQTIQDESQSYAQDVYTSLEAIFEELNQESSVIVDVDTRVSQAKQAAEDALNDLYSQVDKIVDNGYNQLVYLGDALYDPQSYSKVQAIHNNMIDQLRALTLSYSASGFMQLNNVIIYAKLLAAEIQPEEEGFFVGSPAKARDLKAPYKIPNFDLPPVRELFHFDGTDFANIKPVVQDNSDRSITVSDFLNYGGDIPAIWQYMLKDKAFIESSPNLREILDYGCVDVSFFRGGIMPCIIKGSSVILDVTSNGNYIIRDDLDQTSLPNCMLIDIEDGLPHHVTFDAPVRITSSADSKPDAANCQYSELGMLLTSDENNNLQIRPSVFNAYMDILSSGDTSEMDDEQKNALSLAYQAALSRNQIGNFLYFMENEKLQRENLEEYQQKYEQNMATLKEKLSLYGFVPSEDFNLSKDSDYELALKKLKAIKNEKISEAKSALSKVDSTDNEPVKEKMTNLNELISIMQKDTEGVLKLTPTSIDDNNIDAKLKKATADNAVVDKYKKDLKEQYKDYSDIEDPYCSNY